MAGKIGKYQLISGEKITKVLGEETEDRAKRFAKKAAETDPQVELREITEQGAVLIDFRE